MRSTSNKQVLRLILAGASLALLGIWINVTGRGGLFPEGYTQLTRSAFYASRLLSLVVLMIFPRLANRHSRLFSVLGCICICIGTVIYILAVQSGGYATETMRLVGWSFCGLGYYPCLIPIYIEVARIFGLKQALITVLIAYLCKQQVPSLIALLPDELGMWATLLILVALAASLVSFWSTYKSPRTLSRRPVSAQDIEITRYLIALGAVTIITLFVNGTVSGVSLAGEAGSNAVSGVIMTPLGKLVSFAICAGLGYVTIIRQIKCPLIWRFTPAFVVLALSTTLVTIVMMAESPAAHNVVDACLRGVYDFNQFLEWTLAIYIAQQESTLAMRSLAAIEAIYDAFALFIGPISFSGSPTYGPNLFVTFGLVLTIIVAVILPLRIARHSQALLSSDLGNVDLHTKPEVDELDRQTRIALEQALDARCLYLARQYHLTARESEVLFLLCQGHGRAAVCDELHASEGTIKTHITHIYRKMRIGTRQDLANLVFLDMPPGHDDGQALP